MCIVHQMDLESPSAFACAQAGCRECQDALVRRHEGLVYAVLRRQSRDGLPYEELLQEGRVALWKAVLGFVFRFATDAPQTPSAALRFRPMPEGPYATVFGRRWSEASDPRAGQSHEKRPIRWR